MSGSLDDGRFSSVAPALRTAAIGEIRGHARFRCRDSAASTRMACRNLGPLEVRSDHGHSVSFAGHTARAVLCTPMSPSAPNRSRPRRSEATHPRTRSRPRASNASRQHRSLDDLAPPRSPAGSCLHARPGEHDRFTRTSRCVRGHVASSRALSKAADQAHGDGRQRRARRRSRPSRARPLEHTEATAAAWISAVAGA